MLVLGIESTCDETACSVVRDGKEILSNVIASQHDIHSQYGGVFPELASRRQSNTIIPVIDQALNEAAVKLEDIDLIAVAYGPGLMGSLLIGLTAAKALSLATRIPYIGINHVEAHIYAAIMSQDEEPTLPCLGVVLSGGHTHIVKITELGSYQLIGQTVDDAIGEAFDKVAKIMGIPYPGGPKIENYAKNGDANSYSFKVGRIKGKPYDFSFSGVKTGVLYTVRGQNGQAVDNQTIDEITKANISASFQRCIFEDVVKKTLNATKEANCSQILFGGGVTNNQRLREMFQESSPSDYKLYWPTFGLSLDNAAMIAGLGYHHYRSRGRGDALDLEAKSRISLT